MSSHVPTSYGDLPDDESQRIEILQNVFGQQIIDCIKQSTTRIRKLVESDLERKAIGRIRAERYFVVSELDDDSQAAAIGLAEAGIRLFAQQVLAMLDNEGTGLALGTSHHIHYQLLMEIIDSESGHAVENVQINHSPRPLFGKKFFNWLLNN